MLSLLRHRPVQVALVAMVVAIVLGGWWLARRNSVDYVAPRYGPIVEAIYGLGKVKTDRVYEVKLGVPKTVEKLYVREGDAVRKGKPLVRFEGGPLFAAPYDGSVTLIAFREAQSVFPQQTVVRLEDLSTKFIEVSLEQEGALRVQPGQPARVVFESLRGEQINGKVAAVFARNEEFLAHIRVPLNDSVLPGMTADVAIETGRKDKALLVPLSAVSNGRVRVLHDGKRKTVQLKIGGVDGNWAEVIEGDITPDDKVIVRKQADAKTQTP
jgi:multidrug efflux pump subunit AcrA (membrane-fusion protein)